MNRDAEALKNEGNARKAAGDLAGAAERYRAALAVDAAYVPALYNLGVVLREAKDPAGSEAAFRRLLELEPGDVDALFNLGALLRQSRRLEEADDALRRAAALAPENPHLWLYLGQVAIERYTDESLRDAVDSLRLAISLQPSLADAHYRLGSALGLQDQHEEALAAHRRALELEPRNPAYAAAVLTGKQRLCDWKDFDALAAMVRSAAQDGAGLPIEPFDLLSIPSTAAEQLQAARRYARVLAEEAGAPVARPAAAPASRIRIGYLSAEFHEHATAYLAAELFELHDRGRFEVSAYSYGPDDGSPMRSRLRSSFERFVDLRALSDREAAERIAGDGIDILVDLKGYTFRARPGIVALRPAPLQVSYLGYPGTMGAPFIDYLIADRIVIPAEREGDYEEALVLLPDCYQVNDRRRPWAPPPARATLGLPEEGVVLCSFNQPYKILPQTFAIWMRILAAVPGSVLWLLEFNPVSIANLRREAAARGIDPARLVAAPMLPLDRHLARLGAADLFLDTWPYNAHTSGSDALWAGVPVLTCPGETFASRVGASLLKAVGLDELVAEGPAAYEARAVGLASDRGELQRLRTSLGSRRHSAPLFDAPRFTSGLEAAYERMWHRLRAGQPPAPIRLG